MNRGWLVMMASVSIGACATGPTDVMDEVKTGALQISGWTGFAPQESRLGSDGIRWDRPPSAVDVVPPRVIEAPDTVAAGVAFTVTTYTVAPSGCWRAAGQQVAISEQVVQLRPLDQHSGAAICTMALLFPAHRSDVVLNTPGVWTLRVVGRRAGPDGESIDHMIKAEKTIIVR